MRSSRQVAAFSGALLVSVLACDANSAEQQERSPAALSNPLAAQPLDQLSATLDRPLFSPSRRPPAPPPPPPVQVAAPPVPPPSPPSLLLLGVVMDGEGARAIVRAGTEKKLLRAQIGDDIEGWKVSQIEGRKVVLSSLDGRFATFRLFSDDRAKQEPAGPMPGAEPQNAPRQTQAQQTPTEAAVPQSAQPRKRRRSRE
jgi:general secretion pathway protein N